MSDVRPLLPVEHMVYTVAKSQVGRGENPPINTTAGLLLTIERLRNGQKITRRSWRFDEYIALHDVNFGSMMTVPHICFRTYDGELVPWCPSQLDVLALDWSVFP